MRRLLLTVLFLAPSPVLAQHGLDPAVRLGAIRNALEKAKTLKVAFSADLDSDRGSSTVKGTMLLGGGNKVRMELDMNVEGKAAQMIMVSDGTTMRTTIPGRSSREKPIEPNLHKNMLAMIERAGIAVPMFTIPARKGDEVLAVSAVKFLSAEKGIFRCAHKLDVDAKVRFHVELSTHLDTHLPLRRTLRVEKGADPITIVETYSIELNPVLAPDTFALTSKD